MVNWSEFRQFPLEKKIQTIYVEGIFVMAIRYYHYKVNLYLLGNSYVEVFVNHKQSSIEKIDLLDATHTRMKFYSDQIKLPQDI
jgi:hypothetical protein